MNCEEIYELAGAYAIGALPPEEMREVEAHLAECNLHQELASLRATAALLAFVPEEREPPAALRSRIMAAITGERDGRTPAPIPLPVREPRGIRPSYALAAALALLLLGLLIWNIMLLRADNEPRQGFVPAPVTVTNDPATALVGRVTAGSAAGTVMRYIPGERVLILEIAGLPQPAEGRTYQLWALQGKDVISLGIFTTAVDGTTRIAFSSNLYPGDTLAVTEEPAGGSPAPTSEPIFAAPLQVGS